MFGLMKKDGTSSFPVKTGPEIATEAKGMKQTTPVGLYKIIYGTDTW
jgi:hypothetical protein